MKTCYVVANGSTARILRLDAKGRRLRELERFEHPETRASGKELGRDRPGLFRHGSARPGAFTEPGDRKRRKATEFARRLSDELTDFLVRHEDVRIVLVAPPGMCSLIRQHLPVALQSRLAGELKKDYTHATESELLPLLRRAGYAPAPRMPLAYSGAGASRE